MPQKYGKFFFTYLATFICRMGKFSRKHTEWQNSKYLHIYYFEFSRSRFPRYYIFFSVNAMGITFGILTQGSAFWHGSETLNGASADVVINDLFAYVAYQAAVENLLPKESSIIHELSLSPRFVFTIL